MRAVMFIDDLLMRHEFTGVPYRQRPPAHHVGALVGLAFTR
jgi:hypothetical protein